MNEIKNEIEKIEQEEVQKMSEEMRKAFYEFKEIFKENTREQMKKEGKTEEQIEIILLTINFVEMFYLGIQTKEVEEALQVLAENCMIMQNVHDMAYELNSEYAILWDNLDEEMKKDVIKTRKLQNLSNNYEKVRWGMATMGLTALGSKLMKKSQDNKIREYVTSEGFTNLCIIVNKFHNYYNEEGAINEL